MNKNVPNIITMSRVVLTPIMILLFLLPIPNSIGLFAAFGVFVLGSFSDALDGYLARKYNLVSDLGKMLDSIADKFIQTTAIVLILAGTELLPLWAALTCLLIIILRDIWINAIRQICATKGVVVAADFLGKLKSIFLDVAVSVLMFYIAIRGVVSGTFLTYLLITGMSIFVVGVALCLISCVNYTISCMPAVLDKKNTQEK